MLTHFVKRRGIVDDSDDNGSGSVGGDDVYRERVESVLVLLSNLYSEDKISIYDSRPSSHPVYTFY